MTKKIVVLVSSILFLTFLVSLVYSGSQASKEGPLVPSNLAEQAPIQAENQENRITTAYFDSANKRLLLFFASGAIVARQEEAHSLTPLGSVDTDMEPAEPGDAIPLFGQLFPLRFNNLNALFFVTKNCHLNTIIGNQIFSLGALQPDKPPVTNEVTLQPNPYRVIDIKAIVPFGKNRILLCTTSKLHVALSFSETNGKITMKSALVRLHHILSALTYIHQKKLFIGAHTGKCILPGKTFRANAPISSLQWWLDNFWSTTKEVPAMCAGNRGEKIAVATSEGDGSIIRILYCFEHGNRINWSELFRAALRSGEVWRMAFSEDDRWLIIYYTVRFTPQAVLFDVAVGEWSCILEQDDFTNVHPVFVDIRDNQLLVVGADGTIVKKDLVSDSTSL